MPASTSASNSHSAAQFREIHKNTWLKRLSAEGKKITIGPKKSERSWVVFCVHDDSEAMLEGYAEPRQAPCHNPEWIVPLQSTLHISHALIPNSHEFEFVVTLPHEVVRFHAMSWEIMQEWVDTLRLKLREMKIISPRENLYTKLPEIRAPLLPTRDPTSPLPAPPPVPAALVPGVEVIPHINNDNSQEVSTVSNNLTNANEESMVVVEICRSNSIPTTSTSSSNSTTQVTAATETPTSTNTTTHLKLASMSNTLTQNLLNMLSNPMSTYSEQLNDERESSASATSSSSYRTSHSTTIVEERNDFRSDNNVSNLTTALLHNQTKFNEMQLNADECPVDNSIRVDVNSSAITGKQSYMEDNMTFEQSVPRSQTNTNVTTKTTFNTVANIINATTLSRCSHSTSAVTTSSSTLPSEIFKDNVTELEIRAITQQHSNDAIKSNVTIIQVSTNENMSATKDIASPASSSQPPLKILKKCVMPEIFKFPETANNRSIMHVKPSPNVQIIPSIANSNTKIQVLNTTSASATPLLYVANINQSSVPVIKTTARTQLHNSEIISEATTNGTANCDLLKNTTTVHLSSSIGNDNDGNISIYGTCYGTEPLTFTTTTSAVVVSSNNTIVTSVASSSAPKLPNKIILLANTSDVTNISISNVNNATETTVNVNTNRDAILTAPSMVVGDVSVTQAIHESNNLNLHYEKFFLSTSVPVMCTSSRASSYESYQQTSPSPLSPIFVVHNDAECREAEIFSSSGLTTFANLSSIHTSLPNSPVTGALSMAIAADVDKMSEKKSSETSHQHRRNISNPSPVAACKNVTIERSPTTMPHRRRIESPINVQYITRVETAQMLLSPQPRIPLLTRGLTEAVLSSRPSRRDYHYHNKGVSKGKSLGESSMLNNCEAMATNNNSEDVTASSSNSTTTITYAGAVTHHNQGALNRADLVSLEQRRRSSSTSDTHVQRGAMRAINTLTNANNNELTSGGGRTSALTNSSLRIQHPPQPFRSVENGIGNGASALIGNTTTTSLASAVSTKRITLREQQVLQLRREIMHPGGVRLQLRRKDCVGSIAVVDAFGAVWVVGWKQKEHPVLYNALHIGDQLLSITGVAVTSAIEANKIIRNTNTLFIEMLVRRLPFGRAYAIRREREGQCLGLIRDGNTATIVDVVPNSLAARHGLSPKAQSCDGSTLTFWVLTEINSRPLNLFFKDNEIRDRLNSMGRDISILVQPSDLIAKLKKQLKSLRSYKEYLVQ